MKARNDWGAMTNTTCSSYRWLGLAWLGLAWLGLAWLGLAGLGLAGLGLAWLGLAWCGLAGLCARIDLKPANF